MARLTNVNIIIIIIINGYPGTRGIGKTKLP